jgi:phosphohistidine phosphatase
MDLILWRHAQAEDSAPGGDLRRALTAFGRRQAAGIAAWLDARLPATTHVLASPALRAQQTAQALGRRFDTEPAVAPGGAPDALLRAAGWPDADAPVLVVGHQPTLGLVLAHLLGDAQPAPAVVTASVWWLRRDAGATGVRLHAAQAPDVR